MHDAVADRARCRSGRAARERARAQREAPRRGWTCLRRGNGQRPRPCRPSASATPSAPMRSARPVASGASSPAPGRAPPSARMTLRSGSGKPVVRFPRHGGVHRESCTVLAWCSAATAQEASRDIALSEREFRITGTLAPSTSPAPSAWLMKASCLASMLPASIPGHDEDVGPSGHVGPSRPLVRAAARSTALSIASGPSTRPPLIWPRSAIFDSSAASIDDWIAGFTVSTAESTPTRGVSIPMRHGQVDRVLHDVDLGRRGPARC